MPVGSIPFLLVLGIGFGPQDPASGSEYGPFSAKTRPKPFPLQDCTEWMHEGDATLRDPGTVTLSIPDDRKRTQPRIHLSTSSKLSDLLLEIRGGDDKTIAGPKIVSDAMFVEAATGDLNADGQPDFVVRTSYQGQGLGCWNEVLVFAISAGKGYVLSSVYTMFRDESELCDLDGDGKCDLIHVAMLQSDQSDEKDNRVHTYWVYHQLEIKDGRWESAPDNSAFPRWVWFTFKPNRSRENRLSTDAKTRLWKDYALRSKWVEFAKSPDNDVARERVGPKAAKTNKPRKAKPH